VSEGTDQRRILSLDDDGHAGSVQRWKTLANSGA
jgi:hypothetical protein